MMETGTSRSRYRACLSRYHRLSHTSRRYESVEVVLLRPFRQDEIGDRSTRKGKHTKLWSEARKEDVR
jgi:hypothetical protein